MLSYHVLFVTLLPTVLCSCPEQSNMSISTFLILSTDLYQSSEKTAVHDVCKVYFTPVNSNGFVVSITHFFLFSHRQPKNTKEIVIRNGVDQLIIKTESKVYKFFQGAIEIEMPMNLNFRALLVFTVSTSCAQKESFQCFPNSSVCISRDYLCDENDNCGEETNCAETKKVTPMTSFAYDRDALSSSQLMLIGFFVLNFAFIMFFLTLSLCSAGYCFSSSFYYKQNLKSRRTFAKYIRDACKETPRPSPTSCRGVSVEKPLTPPIRKTSGEKRHRPSILSRINFEPAPSLREQEPEAEDQAATSPMAELCAPPIHRHELFLRRQTLPALYNTREPPKKTAWKRASVGGGKLL